jgi:hypothetical protein
MRRPELRDVILWYLVAYMQFRHAYDLGQVWVERGRLARRAHRMVLGTVLRILNLAAGIAKRFKPDRAAAEPALTDPTG